MGNNSQRVHPSGKGLPMVAGFRLRLALLSGLLAIGGCGPAPVNVASTPRVGTNRPKRVLQRPVPVAARVEAPKPTLSLIPASARLGAGDLGIQWIAGTTAAGGGRVDLTEKVEWSAEPAGVVAIEKDGYARPIGPGKARVRARKGDQEATAEVVVAAPEARPWDFAAEIMPILSKQGCNLGGCHGKADGQNGFHLSIFGYDAEGDHTSITRDADGRRLSLVDPEESLFLRKATGQTPHGGGQKVIPGSDAYNTLVAWIAAGAPLKSGVSHGKLTAVKVEPAEIRLDAPGSQQIRVVAHYEDGHDRDVTRLATYRVLDDIAASVDADGKAALNKRAEVDLIVRYGSNVVAARLATIINPDLKFDFSALPKSNPIDAELFGRLEALKVPPSPQASDSAFLRRISLDLIAHQPEPEEVKAFVADADPNKRAKKVDELLNHRDFLKFWELKLGDMLQITSTRFAGGSAGRYQSWLQDRLKANTPWDVMVRELLTAQGDPTAPGNGAANYALDGPDAKSKAEQTAQRFLGLRFRCAQCHDHPFDTWTQDDYFHLAAFFAKTGLGGDMMPSGMMMGRMQVKVNDKATVEHLRTRKAAEPRMLDGSEVKLGPQDDPRKPLADWITRSDNPYFARATANWVWAQFFGKGIADPPDDLSASNPPIHPELLDALAKHFVDHKYDLRDLIRLIATSQAYGLSSGAIPGNDKDNRLFSHQMARPLTAHQMADALALVTGVPNRFQNRAASVRAIDIFDPSNPSTILDTFGRCSRQTGCAATAAPSLSLRQSLLLINGDAVEGKVASLNGYLSAAFQYELEAPDLVESLYLRTLCRYPTAEESSRWVAELKSASSMREAAEDLFWALLNSREFAFNH